MLVRLTKTGSAFGLDAGTILDVHVPDDIGGEQEAKIAARKMLAWHHPTENQTEWEAAMATSADMIRRKLGVVRKTREYARGLYEGETKTLALCLRRAQAHPDISMEEAARLAGFETRQGAYELMKAHPDDPPAKPKPKG